MANLKKKAKQRTLQLFRRCDFCGRTGGNMTSIPGIAHYCHACSTDRRKMAAFAFGMVPISLESVQARYILSANDPRQRLLLMKKS